MHIEQKPSAQQLFNTISQAILAATEPTYLTYEHVDASAGSLIVDSLDQTGEIERINPR